MIGVDPPLAEPTAQHETCELFGTQLIAVNKYPVGVNCCVSVPDPTAVGLLIETL
jgi:hypothetical protein